MNNSSLRGIVPFINPTSRISLTAAASASTQAQGQFSTIDASTVILARPSTANLALNVILAASPFALVSAAGVLDDQGMLIVAVDQGDNAQTVDSITVSTGTLVYQQVGTRFGLFIIAPDGSARVTAAIVLSAGNANTRVTLISRTYNATNTISTL